MPAALWAAGIFWLSTKAPTGETPHWLLENDKLVHAFLFGVLSAGIVFALRAGHRWQSVAAAIGGFVLATLYGATDELHQMFNPNRMADVMDALANAAGAAVVAIASLAVRARPREPAP